MLLAESILAHHGRRFWLRSVCATSRIFTIAKSSSDSHSSTPILISCQRSARRAEWMGLRGYVQHTCLELSAIERYARVHLRLDKMVSANRDC